MQDKSGTAAEEGEEGQEDQEEKGSKDAKTKVKEALDNIQMPKIPKLHKPGFLKKKKSDGGEAANEAEGDKAEGDKEEGEEKKEGGEENQEEEQTEEGAAGSKKAGFLDNIKAIKGHVQLPSFLTKKGSKDKDPEAGEDEKEEESKELLEKKEDGDEEDKKEGDEEQKEANEDDNEKKEAKEEKPASSILDSLRNVASQVPSLFKGSKDKSKKNSDKDADVEAGEKEELLEANKEAAAGDSNDEVKKDELEEVKVVSDKEAAGAEDEKKDAEKPEPPYNKYLSQLREGRDVCKQRYEALDRPKQLGILAVLAGLLLFLFILILVGICAPSDWTNYARISEDGQYVVTHTTCGPIQG